MDGTGLRKCTLSSIEVMSSVVVLGSRNVDLIELPDGLDSGSVSGGGAETNYT